MRLAGTLRAIAILAVLIWSAPAGAGEAYRLYVDGLACPFCAYGVEKILSRVDGVERVDIDIDQGFVTVILAAGATLGEATAAKAIDDAGFSLRRFEAPKKN
jgi:mercuric ion binding protein